MEQQFTFTGRQKMLFMVLMALGAVCLGITFITDTTPHHERFWTNFLHNSVFFTGISFIGLYWLAAHTLGYSGWHVGLKRVMEAMTLFLPVGMLLLLVIAVGTLGHWHHLYHWAQEGITDPTNDNYDALIAGKSALLNPITYIVTTLVVVSVWSIIAYKMRSVSLSEDEDSDAKARYYKKLKFWAGVLLPFGAFSSAFCIWLWIMSIDSHWYSTMFAWYASASWLVSAMCILTLIVLYLRTQGYMEHLNKHHIHDLGKYIFAFSIFWTYVWFSQFMLIWYANIGEETIYFRNRMTNFPVLFYGNIVINFLLPFFVLMRNSTKWKAGSLAFVAIFVLFGHWIDFFQMIKPGIWKSLKDHTAHDHGGEHAVEISNFMMGFHFPGLLEVGTFLGFLGLFLYFVFSRMTKASLIPVNDPYLAESLHYHG